MYVDFDKELFSNLLNLLNNYNNLYTAFGTMYRTKLL